MWRSLGNLWTQYSLWIVGVVCLVVGAFIDRVILPSVGRWGYEKLVTEKNSREKDRKRKKQIRHLLRESFRWNLELLESMEKKMLMNDINKRHIPTFNVDIPILESTAGLVQLEALDDVEAYKIIDRARFELSHVERKINWLSDMFMKKPMQLPLPETKSQDAREELFYQLVRSTILLIQSCKVDCNKAIAELDRLESPENPPRRPGI